MNAISEGYLIRAETVLAGNVLFYFLLNGAQIFETAVLVPKWTSAPPESFGMFRGKYALDLKLFWIVLHSVHEIIFILSIVFCWKITLVRSCLLGLFLLHFLIRLWTLAYFAPRIIHFQKIANGEAVCESLTNQVNQWRKLNYVRVALFLIVSILLLPLCFLLLHLHV